LAERLSGWARAWFTTEKDWSNCRRLALARGRWPVRARFEDEAADELLAGVRGGQNLILESDEGLPDDWRHAVRMFASTPTSNGKVPPKRTIDMIDNADQEEFNLG